MGRAISPLYGTVTKLQSEREAFDASELVTGGAVPISIGMMDSATVIKQLEAAWQHALPGRESCARDHVLRELWRELQQRPGARAPVRLRVIHS